MPASKVMRKLVCPTFRGLEQSTPKVIDSATPGPSSASQVPSNSSSSRVEGEEGEESDVEHEPGSIVVIRASSSS